MSRAEEPIESDEESSICSSSSISEDEQDEAHVGSGVMRMTTAKGSVGQQRVGVLTTLQLSREHQLRRLLGQRKLGGGVPVKEGRPPFQQRVETVADADAILLRTFSNASLFHRLLDHMRSSVASRGPAPTPIDHAIAAVNASFFFNYAMPVRSTALEDTSVIHPTFTEQSIDLPVAPLRRAMTKKSTRASAAMHGETELLVESGRKRGRSDAAKPSASTGIVAQSLQAWEAHLTHELSREGETVDSFRQGRSKQSYLERRRFQEEAEWNEYQRELQLQEKERELAATRAIRRGEVDGE